MPAAPLLWNIESRLPEVVWPAMPGAASAQVLALQFQLERTQWLAPAAIRDAQLLQLAQVLRHAIATVPYYRERLAGCWAPAAALTWETLEALPLLTRRDLQEGFATLASTAVPAQHGAVHEARTSGSTGMPVRVLGSEVDLLYWKALTLREHAWHRRDLGAKLAAIRHGVDEAEGANWGGATDGVIDTGPAATLPVSRDIAEQARWLERQQPAYLLSHPTNLAALAEYCVTHGVRVPGLREVRTSGEAVAPEVRELCRRAWDVELVDMYSSNEVGYMALQCPQVQHYHAMAESVLVEVVDDQGHACKPGQIGRVLVTTLHNFAMPLIRYEVGDLAEVGAPCVCGRGLPVLSRILGRVRNMLVLASGERYWPSFGMRSLTVELGIRQHQVVQKTVDLLEARLVVAAPLNHEQEERLRARLLSTVPPGFRIELVYCDEIARSAGGKFEDFMSEVGRGRA